jgi:hypothetical protein
VGIERKELVMRNQAKIVGIALCALAAAACGGDGDGNGTGGTGGTGATGGTGGTGGAQTSTVNGTVRTFFSEFPVVEVPDATVRVLGTNLSATTRQDGTFTIENVPNGENFFTVEAPGHWGSVDYWDVPTETNQGFVLLVVTDADIDSAALELGDRTISDNDAIVEVFFDPAVTGASATIDPPNHDPPFTLDADGFLVVQNTVIEVDGVGDLFFTSVPAGGTITADVTGPSGTTCEVIESDTGTYPVNPKSITVVYATCQ